MSFTSAEGVELHREPMARSMLEQRMFDWLDETLSSQRQPAVGQVSGERVRVRAAGPFG